MANTDDTPEQNRPRDPEPTEPPPADQPTAQLPADQPEQPRAQAGTYPAPGGGPPPPGGEPPRPGWRARRVSLWVAALVSALLLLGGGLGGYFIGVAADGPDRPGFGRHDGPGWPHWRHDHHFDGPGWRGGDR